MVDIMIDPNDERLCLLSLFQILHSLPFLSCTIIMNLEILRLSHIARQTNYQTKRYFSLQSDTNSIVLFKKWRNVSFHFENHLAELRYA